MAPYGSPISSAITPIVKVRLLRGVRSWCCRFWFLFPLARGAEIQFLKQLGAARSGRRLRARAQKSRRWKQATLMTDTGKGLRSEASARERFHALIGATFHAGT